MKQMKVLRSILLLWVFSCVYLQSTDASYVGCYKEPGPFRHYSLSPGNYNPDTLTITECQNLCGLYKHSYAAMADVNYCFCANQLSDPSNVVTDDKCMSQCTDLTTDKCGTQYFSAVYRTAAQIIGFEVAVDTPSTGIVEIFNPISFKYKTDVGTDAMVYSFDYGDGAGQTKQNETDMWLKSFSLPGEKTVKGLADDQFGLTTGKMYSRKVLAQAPAKNITLQCPPAVATWEEFSCNASVMSGSNMIVTMDWKDNSKDNFSVADTLFHAAGPGVPNVAASTTDAVSVGNTVYIMPGSEFLHEGALYAFEYFTAAIGTTNSMEILLLSPDCSVGGTSYCHKTKSCESSCTASSSVQFGSVSCGANEFCSAKGVCTPSCTVTNRYVSNKPQYRIQKVFTVPSVAAGTYGYYLIPDSDQTTVNPGDIIGYKGTTGGVLISTRPVIAGELSDVNMGGASTAVSTLLDLATGSSINQRHNLRAVATKPSWIKFYHVFNNIGLYTVHVNICTEFINSCAEDSFLVTVELGIDFVIIDSEEYGKTGADFTFNILPHLGNNVTYNWDFGDGSTDNTTAKTIKHQYSRHGSYNVTVVGSNSISSKENMTTIIIEDCVENITVKNIPAKTSQNHPFEFSGVSGSDFTCEWLMGPPGVILSSTNATTPITGGVLQHMYTAPGTQQVTVNCSNHVCYDVTSFNQIVQDVILGLDVMKRGAIVGDPIRIEFFITQGTDVSFNVTFNNQDLPDTYDQVTMKGFTGIINGQGNTGIVDLTIVAWNLVSTETLNVNFTIEEPIIGAVSTTSLGSGTYVMKGDSMTFSAGATSGTSIEIYWNFGDGSANESYISAPVAPWPLNQKIPKTRIFSSAGSFVVDVTVRNNFNISNFKHPIDVYNKVANLTLTSLEAVEFQQGKGSMKFWFTTTGEVPTKAKVVFDWGDGTTQEFSNFQIHPLEFEHTYTEPLSFIVTANVSNLVSFEVYTSTVTVVVPVENLGVLLEPSHAVVNQPVVIATHMDTGSGVTIHLYYGDGSAEAPWDRKGVNAWDMDNKTHTYSTVGIYTITVVATNILGNTTKDYIVYVQNPVTTDFQLTVGNAILFGTGSNTLAFTLTYTGSTLPSNASMFIDYGDGTAVTEITPFPFSGSGPYSYSFSYQFLKAGGFDVNVTIKNMATELSFIVNAGVYEPINSLEGQALWQRYMGLYEPGLTALQNQFRMDKEVYFNMTYTGTVVQWRVMSIESTASSIQLCNYSNTPISVSFNMPGTWEINITAWNELQPMSWNTTVVIFQAPTGISVKDPNQGITTRPNETKYFEVSFQDVGGDTCLLIDWGDGKKSLYANDSSCQTHHAMLIEGVISTSMTLSHKYMTEELFTLKANASNAAWHTDTSIRFMISRFDCNTPRLQIQHNMLSIDYTNPISAYKSKPLQIIAVTTLDCSVTLDNNKIWTVEKLDSQLQVEANIDLNNLPTIYNKSNPEIALPARFLDVGLYRFKLRVEMVSVLFPNNAKFASEVYTVIDIKKTPLIAALAPSGLSMMSRGVNTNITLDAANYSRDPDVATNVDQGITQFKWRCKESSEPMNNSQTPLPLDVSALLSYTGPDNGGCFKRGSGPIVTNAGKLTFTTRFMQVNKTYEFHMTAIKGDRSSTTIFRIQILKGDPPLLEIRCSNAGTCQPGSDGLHINPSSQIKLVSHCGDSCPLDMQFEWSMYRKGLVNSWILVDNFDQYVQGLKSYEIGIDPKLFAAGYGMYDEMHTYRIKLKGTLNGNTGEAFTTLRLNQGPLNGNCSINNTYGVEFETTFHLECSGWYDPDLIASYKFYALFQEDQIPKEISFSYRFSVDVFLPLGPSYDNYSMNIFAKIYDTKGAFSEVHLGKVQVMRRSYYQLQAALQSLYDNSQNQVITARKQGNILEANLVFGPMANAINTEAALDQSAYGNVDIASHNIVSGYGPTYKYYSYAIHGSGVYSVNGSTDAAAQLKQQYEVGRNQRAVIRTEMAQALSDMTIANIGDIQLTLSTLNTISYRSEELNRDGQIAINKTLSNIKVVLDTLAPDTPVGELKTTATLLLGLTGNALEAARFAQVDATIGDIEQTKGTDYYVYITDWEEGAGYQGKTIDEAKTVFGGDANRNHETAAMKSMVPTGMGVALDILDKVGNGMVAGEVPFQIVTPKIVATVNKNIAANVTGRKHSQGNGSFVLPSWCDMAPDKNNCNSNETVTLVSMVTAANFIGSAPNSNDVPFVSGTISINMLDRSGNTMEISNTAQPIVLDIHRTTNTTPPMSKNYIAKIPNRDTDHLFYNSFNVTTDHASLHITIRPVDPNVQFLVLVRYGEFPKLNRTNLTEPAWDYLALIPHNISAIKSGYVSVNDSDPFTIFIDNLKLNNYVGRVILGLRQLDPSEFDLYSDTNLPGMPTPFTGRFTTDYSMALFTSGCYFLPTNNIGGSWKSEGCRVTAKTTYKITQCECNHLTTFGGGFAVQPNAIDFNFVFANMDFYKNMTLYITEILIAVIYIGVAIWARRQDCKDIQKLGVTPLTDNDPKDRYLYEIQISTGSRKNAATDSKVHLILSGEYDETDVRLIEDPQRKIFRRGACDNFLMATPRPLGPIQYARIWHDNTGKGKFQGWYSRFIVVHDLQTKEKFFFIINEWFAVEEADGQIDRLVPVAGPENMVEFNVLFSQKTRKNLSDEHIWFSVVARPPTSRFTRLQRVSCCLCLLFTSMLANAMFYERAPSGAAQNGFVIGPFSLSPEQIYVGIIANLIVFPINFLLVTLFRKSRPRKKRPSRIQDALKRAHYEDTISTGSGDKKVLVDHASDHAADPQFSAIDSRASTPKLSPAQPLQPAHQPNMTTLNMDTFAKSQQKEKVKSKKKAFTFPWWFRIVSWILLWLVVLVCAAFVTFYGVSFGDIKCKKWITSMVISFVTSIFLTQPIKVFLVAMLFALFFKKVDMEEEADEDEEEIKLKPDETWLHQYPDPEGFMPTRERKIAYAPPNPEILVKAREQRLKELKMYDILREILFYCIYVWILLVVSYGFRDPNAFIMKNSLANTFLDAGLGKLDVSTPDNDFKKMVTYDNFFNWLENTLVPSLRAAKWYNNQNPFFQRGMVGDRISRMMGFATMRQLRIQKNTCHVPIVQLRHLVNGCDYGYNILNEDTENYGVGWRPLEVNGTWNNSKTEYTYRTGASLDSYPYWAKQAVYSGGGYVVELRGSEVKMKQIVQQLRRDEWVDNHTRAIFIEFTVYNANVNLFGITTLVTEFLISGGLLPSYRIEPMNLLGYISGVSVFQVICEVMFLLFILFFIIKECRNLYREKKTYFKQFWNWVEVCIIVLSITCVIIYFYRWFYAKKLTELFKVSHGNAYMKFQYAGYWNEVLMYFLGMLCFLGSIKFIRLLRFNRRVGMLASTLRYGAKSLFLFLIMFLIMFMAYAMFFYLIYYHRIDNFRTIITTMETLIQMLVGKFNFNAMQQADPIMGPLVFMAYVVTVYYILMNMFLTILNESFATVRADINEQANDHEMVEFIMSRFKTWTGINSLLGVSKKNALTEGSQEPKIETQLQAFPEKVDRLLDILCKAYINSDYFDAMFDSNSHEGKAAMKNLIRGSQKSHNGKDDNMEGACAYPSIKNVKPWEKGLH